MKTKKLGWTDLNLSVVGLGTFAIGGTGWQASWGKQDDSDSIATILQAIDEGINWIDTAPIYGFGHAEEVVGEAIKDLHEKPIIATKGGLIPQPGGGVGHSLNRESITREIDASLKRLGIDVIDLYFVHWPIPDEDIEDAWVAISDAVKVGKVRYAAASNFSVDQMKRIQDIHPVAALQSRYNMLSRNLEYSEFLYCAESNIGVVPWGPIGHGILTGKFDQERVKNLDENDSFRRNEAPYFKEPELSASLELVEKLKPIAKRSNRSLSQLAIAWVLRRPEVTSAIVGGRKPLQMVENAAISDYELSPADIAEIDVLLKERDQILKSA